MNEYFFLVGKDQKGPFTIEQMKGLGLSNETLIWTEGMKNWTMLKDIPVLAQTIKLKSVPPPPPPDTDKKISKTEVSGQLKVTMEKTPNPAFEAIKPNKITLTWLIIWCGFHLFALLMSYSQIKIFNDNGKPETKEFWPVVEFTDSYKAIDYVSSHAWNIKYKNETRFNGLFTQYDWTELAFYVGGAIVIYLLVRVSNKDEEKKMT